MDQISKQTDHLNEQVIRDFLAESLEDHDSEKIEQHIEMCHQCRLLVEHVVDPDGLTNGSSMFSKQHDSHETDSFTSESNTSIAEKVVSPDSPESFVKQIEQCGRFIVSNELGRGGMGIVYRGFDRQLKRQVAIKVLKASSSRDAQIRFYREAQITGQLQHPGIVPIHELGHLRSGIMFIAMKLVDGQSFHQLIHEANLTQSSISEWEIFGQVCQTMAYVHSRNFIHRDLKPKNIMIGAFGEVQITDWGVARKIENATSKNIPPDNLKNSNQELCSTDSTQPTSPGDTLRGDVIGTPAYMPPEQAKGDFTDKRSDVFALGGVLFEILTRKSPFDEPTATKALSKASQSDLGNAYRHLESCDADADLVALAKTCLDPDPENRPADAQQVNKLFSELLDQREQKLRTIQLEKVRSEERLDAQRKKNRQLVWSMLSIAGVLVLSMIVAVLYLAEKNARLKDQAKLEREQNEARLVRESQIIEHISNAREFQRLAVLANSDRTEQWTKALFELKNVEDIVDESINSKLKKEYDEARKSIQSLANLAREHANLSELEETCERRILDCINQSYLPDELKPHFAGRPIEESFQAIYSQLRIEPTNDFVSIQEYMDQSPIRTTLIRAIPIWQNKLAQNSHADQSLINWLGELITQVDQDPFRNRIRSLIKTSNKVEAAREIRKVEATESLQTMYLCMGLKDVVNRPDYASFMQRAYRKYPNDFTVNWNLARSAEGRYLKSPKRRQTAIQHMLVCYSMQPKNVAVMLKLSGAYILDGQFEPACKILEDLVAIVPDYPMAYSNLVTCHASQGRLDKALDCCERFLTVTNEAPNALVLRATMLQKSGKHEEAKLDLQRAEKLAPNLTTIHEQFGKVHRSLGDLHSAIKSTKKLIELRPKSGPPRQYLAILYMASHQLELAEQSLKELCEVLPNGSAPITFLAKFYLRQDRPEEAKVLLQEAISNGVNSNDLQITLAKTFLATNEKNRAIAILERISDLTSKSKKPTRRLRKNAKSLFE